MSMDNKESPFWRFSLTLYRQDGVPPACIALQDRHGVDVNVMLYGLWLAAAGRALSVQDMLAIDALVRDWRGAVVVPLRRVRRALKEPPAAFDTPATKAMRERVKAVELESERLQQEALYAHKEPAAWGRSEPDLQRAASGNLAAYAQALGVTFDGDAQSAMLNGMQALAASGRLSGFAE